MKRNLIRSYTIEKFSTRENIIIDDISILKYFDNGYRFIFRLNLNMYTKHITDLLHISPKCKLLNNDLHCDSLYMISSKIKNMRIMSLCIRPLSSYKKNIHQLHNSSKKNSMKIK